MQRSLALLIGVTAGFSFGTAAIFIRYLPYVDSNTIAFARLFIGFLALLILLTARKQLPLLIKFIKQWGYKQVLMGVLLGLHFIFFVSSVKHTTVLHATIFVNTAPIQALIVSVLIFKIKPSRRDFLAIFLGFSGIIIITLSEAITPSGNIIGDLEAVLAAFFEAFYLNIGSDLRKEYNTDVLMASNFLLGSAVVFFYAIPIQGGIMTSLSINEIVILLALGLIPTALGHSLYVASVKSLKPYETATMALLEPISASILALILFMEVPSIVSIFGSALIAIAILLLFSSE
ncbi:MAG: DMT family transporter [Candidatus Asgardarchaeia archaeon]